MKKVFMFFFFIFFLTASHTAICGTVYDVSLPDRYEVDDYLLMLNGTALRKEFMIKKVYAGAFYMPFKISDIDKALDPVIPKAIRMHFISKSISGDKIQKTYTEVYKKDGFDYENLEIAREFLKIFSFEVKKNDTLDLVFPGNGNIRVVYNSEVVGTVNSERLCIATLKAYFGIHSLPGIREGFLGVN